VPLCKFVAIRCCDHRRKNPRFPQSLNRCPCIHLYFRTFNLPPLEKHQGCDLHMPCSAGLSAFAFSGSGVKSHRKSSTKTSRPEGSISIGWLKSVLQTFPLFIIKRWAAPIAGRNRPFGPYRCISFI